MIRQTPGEPYNRILFTKKKEHSIDKCNDLDVSQRHYAERKEPSSKGDIPCGSNYMTFSKGQDCSDKGQIHVC